jgi:TRAP-type mannitol/chloroaromatic compound transport system permease small subunit
VLANVSILFTGIGFIVFGRYLLFDRTFHQWDMSPIDMGSYHWVIGIMFIVGGSFFVYNATIMIIRDKRKGRPPR